MIGWPYIPALKELCTVIYIYIFYICIYIYAQICMYGYICMCIYIYICIYVCVTSCISQVIHSIGNILDRFLTAAADSSLCLEGRRATGTFKSSPWWF